MTMFGCNSSKIEELKFKSDTILELAKKLKKEEKTFLTINKEYKKSTLEKTTWPSVFASFNVINEYTGDFAPYHLGSHEIILRNNSFNKKAYGRWVIGDNGTSKKIEVGFPTFTARTIYKPEFVKVCGNLISSITDSKNDFSEVLGLMYQYVYLYRICYDKGKAKKYFEDLNLNDLIYDINDFLHANFLFSQSNLSFEDYQKHVDNIRRRLISLEASLQLIDRVSEGKIKPFNMVREIEQQPYYPQRTKSFIVQNTLKLEEGKEVKKAIRMRKNTF